MAILHTSNIKAHIYTVTKIKLWFSTRSLNPHQINAVITFIKLLYGKQIFEVDQC